MHENPVNPDVQSPQAPVQPITTLAVPAAASEGSTKAGFILRGGAYFIDTLIFGIFAIIFTVLFPDSEELFQGLFGLLTLVYFWLATGIYGTTLGKKFYHLRVIRTDDAKVGLGKAFLREFVGRILSSLIFSLGYFWVIWDKEKQGWHDKIAKTYVVQDAPVGKGKMFLAYVVTFTLPIIAILGIFSVIVLAAINPTRQLEKARKAQEELERQQQEFQQNLPPQNQLQYN